MIGLIGLTGLIGMHDWRDWADWVDWVDWVALGVIGVDWADWVAEAWALVRVATCAPSSKRIGFLLDTFILALLLVGSPVG